MVHYNVNFSGAVMWSQSFLNFVGQQLRSHP